MTLWHDERGALSAARVYLSAALVYQAAFLPIALESGALGVVLTFFTAIDTSLIVWAAGPRIAQYLGPSIGQAVQGVGEAAKALAERVAQRRDPKTGVEASP